MNKKFIAVMAVVLFICSAGLVSAQNVDAKIVGFESSVVFSYDVNAGTMGYGNAFGLILPLTDFLSAGFIYTDASGSLADSFLLTFAYGVADKVGVNLAVGSSSAAALVGVGMYYNIFERKVQDTLISILKLKVAYNFAPASGIDAGDIVMGLSLGFGL